MELTSLRSLTRRFNQLCHTAVFMLSFELSYYRFEVVRSTLALIFLSLLKLMLFLTAVACFLHVLMHGFQYSAPFYQRLLYCKQSNFGFILQWPNLFSKFGTSKDVLQTSM